MSHIFIISLILIPVFGGIGFTFMHGQIELGNWRTYVDSHKTFSLLYPPGWAAKGKENMSSSPDLTLVSPNSTRALQITVNYIKNDSSISYAENEIIIPENDLHNFEAEIMPAYRLYTVVGKGSQTYDVDGFPTASHIVNYAKNDGQAGRILNVIAIVNGKSTFLLSYYNTNQAFYKSLPIVNEIINSIVLLK